MRDYLFRTARDRYGEEWIRFRQKKLITLAH